MKLVTALISLLILFTLFPGCGRNDRIQGKVQDVFGNSLEGVTVKIQKSTFTATTNGSGSYSLDYAPGSMKLIYSKQGYTTTGLELNIQQKSHFPAEAITLYPIPQDSGIFYVDMERKQLVKMEQNGNIEEVRSQNPGFSFTSHYRYFVKTSGTFLTMRPGKLVFIDKIPDMIVAARVGENGLFFEADMNMFERRDKYSGILKDSGLKAGEEGLLVRTVELAAGSYAWVKMFKNDMIGAIPARGGAAFSFKVEGAASK